MMKNITIRITIAAMPTQVKGDIASSPPFNFQVVDTLVDSMHPNGVFVNMGQTREGKLSQGGSGVIGVIDVRSVLRLQRARAQSFRIIFLS